MASASALLLLSGAFLLLAHGAGAAARCDAVARADAISRVCVRSGSGSSSPDCCRIVLRTVKVGGIPCLCLAAATPMVQSSGHTATDFLTWYHTCGGRRPVNASNVPDICSGSSEQGNDTVKTVTPVEPKTQVAEGHLGTNTSQGQPSSSTKVLPVVTAQLPQAQVVPVVVSKQEGHSFFSGWPWYGVVILILSVSTISGCLILLCCCCRRFDRCAAWCVSGLLSSMHMLLRAQMNSVSPTRSRRSNSSNNGRRANEILPQDQPPLIQLI